MYAILRICEPKRASIHGRAGKIRYALFLSGEPNGGKNKRQSDKHFQNIHISQKSNRYWLQGENIVKLHRFLCANA
ncbi:MAG: hypothetical protein JW706_07555, partial [Opitutales bacterium]|nr:hypothetical protein [Opitutales bacterium]